MGAVDTSHDTETVRPTIRLEGQADDRVSNLINSLQVEEHEGGMSSLEVTFQAMGRLTDATVDQVFEDEQLIKIGTNIAVYTGPQFTRNEVFRGVVTAVEGRWSHDDRTIAHHAHPTPTHAHSNTHPHPHHPASQTDEPTAHTHKHH